MTASATATMTKKRFKGRVGDDAMKKRKLRGKIIQKRKVNSSWPQFTKRGWFRSVKAYLLADSFGYGPLIDQSCCPCAHNTLADIRQGLKKAFVGNSVKVLKEALERSPRALKEALITGTTRKGEAEQEAAEVAVAAAAAAVGESNSEENHSQTGGGGQVLQNHTNPDAGGEYRMMMSKHYEVGTGKHVVETFQQKVVTTTATYDGGNEVGELKSLLNMAPPHSPLRTRSVDQTLDTEVTEAEEVEGDEEQSIITADGQITLDFETAETVAAKLIEKMGGRFSEELGIHVDAGDDEVERWFLAANLFSRTLPFNVSKQTYKELVKSGISKVTDFVLVDEATLAELFERTGYTKYGQRVAHYFHKLANQLRGDMWGRVTTLKHTTDPAELTRRLRALNGVKLSAVHSFMRELRGVWRACDTDFDNRTKKAAVHLKLLRSIKPTSDPEDVLMTFALEAGIDARDLEVACFKLGVEHEKEYGNCRGGSECEVLTSTDRLLSTLP